METQKSRAVDLDFWWYVKAFGIFVLFNLAALIGVLLFHRKQWHVDVMQFRHYTSLVFQTCGIIYALFLGFIVWDVWERFYEVKRTSQDEAKYLVDLSRDATVFGKETEDHLQSKFEAYLKHVIHVEWPHMEHPGAFEKGDEMVHGIWKAYYAIDPKGEKESIWYTESLRKLNEFTDARLTRIFNHSNSVGVLRWILLLVGGLFLISMPCFFKIDILFFKLFLVFFLANIIAFMLFIVFSLDHPFTGYVEIETQPLEYALQTIKPW